MATRKEAKRKTLLQVLTLVVIAAVVVAVVVLAQSWIRNQPAPEPADTALEVTVGGETTEIYPYMIAEPGVEPEEGDVPTIQAGEDETVTVTVPDHVSDHDWSAVLIYDDPAANDQILHGPHDTNRIEVPVSVDPTTEDGDRPLLMVVEIQSVMIGTDADGNEAPFTTVWSVATQHAESTEDAADGDAADGEDNE